ncbi:FHS family L-fucose permease-like MFS transporter [Mucilaginibacter gracilis]|uniref:FHS family L-fucose permease-like MFS transporter n=1 Tax=Mucilaginibacter gracilis TaxID=423350 RepID=A0A495IWY7_9SPHI|nr:L-fucose:H+ symporter permease [Mucilaginibacter gracilis]RKR80871.1 FHS family L-fucose permease-like MFS transporter [Mucilaginibacter gracilis]
MQPIATPPVKQTGNNKGQTFAFILITSLFFLWGFAHNLDPILIPHLKKSFTLSTVQATLVDSAVFAAYFIMAIPAGVLMKKFGYKTGIITGLLTFALGSFLFVPAANTQSYTFFLIALFIIACGLATLETAANPYATALGDPETGTFRLNLAQSFNGLAAALAPIAGARIILTKGYTDGQLNAMTEGARKLALAAEASSVKMPYIILGTILVIIALAFSFTKLPKIQQTEEHPTSQSIFHAFKHKHLSWGVVAQFFYVGAQVSVFSLFILYATKSASITEVKAADYLGVCGAAFLIGRISGTVLMKFIKPNVLLAIYAIINVALCAVAITGHGMITVYNAIGICFFMSIMFPTIFALGIKGLGGDTEFGSSLIIMSIVGGAIIPRFFGMISDATGNIQNGYIVPLVCFVVIAVFGLSGYKIISKTDVETAIDPGNLG